MIKLTLENIIDLGDEISEKFLKLGINNSPELTIHVEDEITLKKIDEELFYKLNQKSDGSDFTPSDELITIKFSNCNIKIIK